MKTKDFSLESIGAWEGLAIELSSSPFKIGICKVCGSQAHRETGRYCLECWSKQRIKNFMEKLVNKYGENLICDLKKLQNSPYSTLQEIGNKYSITRERVRQIFNKLYGESFGKYTIAKSVKYKKIKEDCDMLNSINCTIEQKIADFDLGILKGKGIASEVMFAKKCKELGFDIKYSDCGRGIDFEVNGKTVELKSRHSSTRAKKSRGVSYYNVHFLKHQRTADFFVVHVVPQSAFYIIPSSRVMATVAIPNKITNYYNSGTGYLEFKEAWYLLRLTTTAPRLKSSPASFALPAKGGGS